MSVTVPVAFLLCSGCLSAVQQMLFCCAKANPLLYKLPQYPM